MALTQATAVLWLAFAGGPPDHFTVRAWPQSSEAIVAFYADANLVPRWMAKALIREESGFNRLARSYKWDQDRHGTWKRTTMVLAEGFCQITADTDDRADLVTKAGMAVEDFNPWDIEDSLQVGMAFAGRLLVRFDYEFRPATAGYNCGMYGAARWYFDGAPLPRETVGYVKRVLGRG